MYGCYVSHDSGNLGKLFLGLTELEARDKCYADYLAQVVASGATEAEADEAIQEDIEEGRLDFVAVEVDLPSFPKAVVMQTRWIGSDDWTNAVYVGFTVEAVQKALVDELNEDLKGEHDAKVEMGEAEFGSWPPVYTSFQEAMDDCGDEFQRDTWSGHYFCL